MHESIKPKIINFTYLGDAQAAYEQWRIATGLADEQQDDIVRKLNFEVEELIDEAWEGDNKWNLASEATDIFMFAMTTLTSYGISMDSLFRDTTGKPVTTFQELELYARDFLEQQKSTDQFKGIIESARKLGVNIEIEDSRMIREEAAHLLLYTTGLVNSYDLPMAEIFTGKFNRNEHKYPRVQIGQRIGIYKDMSLSQAMLESRMRWKSDVDKEFLKAQVGGDALNLYAVATFASSTLPPQYF